MGDCAKVCIGLVVLTAIICAIALPLSAISSLEPSEIGLAYSAWSKKIDETQLYVQGRHSIGLHNRFVKYKAELQTLQFQDIAARSKDGLKVSISVSFQFRFNDQLESMVALFYQFPFDTYLGAYLDQSVNAIRNTAANFEAFNYVTNRTDIESQLRSSTLEMLAKYGAKVENFQVLQINYPVQFQDSIENAQNSQLQIESVTNNKQKIIQEQEGRVKRAEVEKNIIINQAQIQSTDIIKTSEQIKQNYINRLSSLQVSLVSIQNNINFTPGQLTNFVWLQSQQSILDKSKTKVPIQINTPISISDLYK